MKTYTLDGIDYTPESVRGVREDLIPLRDERLTNLDFDEAVILSHTIALLEYLATLMENKHA